MTSDELHLENLADGTDAEKRLANLRTALAEDPEPLADTARWLLRCLEDARFALKSVREHVEAGDADVEILECVREGLELHPDE